MGGLGGSLTVTGYSSLVISFACSTVVYLSVPVLASTAVSPSPYGYGRKKERKFNDRVRGNYKAPGSTTARVIRDAPRGSP